jgi:hypothetical protein
MRQTVCLPLFFVFMPLGFAAKKGLFREITEEAEKAGIGKHRKIRKHRTMIVRCFFLYSS